MIEETKLARQCLKMIETARIHQSLEVHLGYRLAGDGGIWEAVVYVGARHGDRDRFEGSGGQ